MSDERIKVKVTPAGRRPDVVVLSKRFDMIEVVLGEGVHSMRCRLSPTRHGMAYAGNAMGREIVYERARGDVVADLERANIATGTLRRPWARSRPSLRMPRSGGEQRAPSRGCFLHARTRGPLLRAWVATRA